MLHGIDLSRFKVIHGEKVLRAVALSNIEFSGNEDFTSSAIKPKFLDVLVVNSDGNLEISIHSGINTKINLRKEAEPLDSVKDILAPFEL